MRDDELKPCPFCGGSVRIKLIFLGLYGVCCDDCEVNVIFQYNHDIDNREAIVKEWNKLE